MEIRQVQKSDGPELLQIWNEAAHFDPITDDLLAEKIWDDPQFDKELVLGMMINGTLAAWCMGVVRNQTAGCIGYVKMIAVAEKFQSRGVGTRLLNSLEDHLFNKGAEEIRVGESNPNYLMPGLDPRYTKAWLMFQNRNYQKFATTHNLIAPLDQQGFNTSLEELKLAEDHILIRQAEADDLPAVEKLICGEWPAWIHEVRRSFGFAPKRIHIAVDEYRTEHQSQVGSVVGFASYDGNNSGTGVFGPMGTHSNFRGKGIGSILLKRCMRDLKLQGYKQAIIPWVGPISFYTREVHARIDRVFDRFRKVKPLVPAMAS